MQIEIYNMTVLNDKLNISLEAVCDSFSSLLWDIEYYKCGAFEVYIAASPQNIEIFQTGRIVGRDDDKAMMEKDTFAKRQRSKMTPAL